MAQSNSSFQKHFISHPQLQDAQCVLQLMMTYDVETPEMGVPILSNGVGNTFSVRPAAGDDLDLKTL